MEASTTIAFTYDKKNLSDDTLKSLYQDMLVPRMIEEKMLILLRQGKISKWFSGIGQEAISVGVTNALTPDEYILPMHRNLGVFTTRKIPLWKLFAQWQGKEEGFTKGRDRSFHFGTQEYNIVGMISHLGPQLAVAGGIALAHTLKNNGKATAVFTGEGGTSEGDFHEALNVASVWDLPVLFCIENNGYGLSTPTHEQYRCENLADRGAGYGMESHIIDGNNILEVYTTLNQLANSIRENPRPILLEFKTFRRRGHEEASGTKYVPKALMDAWEAKDPLINYENYLLQEGVLTKDEITSIKARIIGEINDGLDTAGSKALPQPNINTELQDVFAPFEYKPTGVARTSTELRFVDAIQDGLRESMRKYDDLVIMGQDVADYGGVFKITDGFMEEFGKGRVRNTPICESAIVSAAMGLSINGMKSVMEMQFADFVTSGFNPIVNYLAKSHYRWAQKADVVVRMPCGAGVAAGPFHSQTNEAWFLKTPGLKVVYPAFPADAKGLLTTAIEDPNPVLFFEHKKLYRSVRGDVPAGYYTIPFGKAALIREGTAATIITYGQSVHWAMEIIDEMQASIELIDLRTLAPWDKEAVRKSVVKNNRVLVLTEDSTSMSLATDIAAWIGDECFQYLDAPVKVVGSLETPIPFQEGLEKQYLASNFIKDSITELLHY